MKMVVPEFLQKTATLLPQSLTAPAQFCLSSGSFFPFFQIKTIVYIHFFIVREHMLQHYPTNVPGYFPCLHVVWDRMSADFLFSKVLLGQFIVGTSVWSDAPAAHLNMNAFGFRFSKKSYRSIPVRFSLFSPIRLFSTAEHGRSLAS